MTTDLLHFTYANVCDAPSGSSLNIHRLPRFLDEDPNDNFTGHVHSFYEIIWFQSAGGTHTVDFQDYPIEENTLIFLAPGQVHHFDGRTRHRGVLIQFCTDFMHDEQAHEDIFLKYDVFNSLDTPLCQLTEPGVVSALEELVSAMEREIEQRQAFGHIDMLRSLVRQFLILVYRHGHRPSTCRLDVMKPGHRLYMDFRRQVELDYCRHHGVQHYAEALHVGVKTLSNSVAECTGLSPLVIINNRLTLEARRLMRHSTLLVKEVADRLGFQSPTYFVKFFRRQVGVSPLEFR